MEAAERYRQIHLRITRLYEWRGCSSPEELADETFDRVASKLEAGVEIQNPEHYIVRVASFVFKEIMRREIRQRKALEAEPAAATFQQECPAEKSEHGESRLICFRSCLDGLEDSQRYSLLRYYDGDTGRKIKARRQLAEKLGLAAGALRIHMYRQRQRLESCVVSCMKKRSAEGKKVAPGAIRTNSSKGHL